MSKRSLALKALRQLGPRQLGLYALYQVSLRSGYLRWKTRPQKISTSEFHTLFNFPDPEKLWMILGDQGVAGLKESADEIVGGHVRLFGGLPVPLVLRAPGETLAHWTAYERGQQPWGAEDVKDIWEPARFGWVYTLGCAYWLTADERYPQAFWRFAEIFWQHNPVNNGPNWVSAQEVALRLMALVFAAQIFTASESSTLERVAFLKQSIADHAARIPASLIYARAQNNNHLLSEAVGLITASAALPDHPDARRWQRLGWRWFNWGIAHQISADGAYMQNSANYHRLILQLALWLHAMTEAEIPTATNVRLAAATRWLLAICDPATGRVPNLGPNDGAYILPLTNLSIYDYRPVLGAASLAFLGKKVFPPGLWDEMSLWFSVEGHVVKDALSLHHVTDPVVLREKNLQSWAYLRVAQFRDRPGHADQLHLDLWWRGHNIAQDAGTYRYSAASPWENALTHSAVHNTVTVANREQMTRAGRFLYLDWAQARIIECSENTVVAEHDGYRCLGITHRRTVRLELDGTWAVEDALISNAKSQSVLPSRLHWLLPDWQWQFDEENLTLKVLSPYGWIVLNINVTGQSAFSNHQSSIMRAGELLHGTGTASPIMGWVSPTYGEKVPAISFALDLESCLPLKLISTWTFP